MWVSFSDGSNPEHGPSGTSASLNWRSSAGPNRKKTNESCNWRRRSNESGNSGMKTSDVGKGTGRQAWTRMHSSMPALGHPQALHRRLRVC